MMNIYKSLTEDDGQSAGVLKNLLEEPDMDKLLNNPFKITAGDVKVSTLRKNKRGLNVFYRHFGNFVVEQFCNKAGSLGETVFQRERERAARIIYEHSKDTKTYSLIDVFIHSLRPCLCCCL